MKIVEYLQYAVDNKASDLFVIAGRPVSVKIEKNVRSVDDIRIMPDETKSLIQEIYELAKRDIDKFLQTGDDDFSFAIKGVARFRVNVYKQRDSLAAVIRVIAFHIPDWKQMHIPEEVMKLANVDSGIIIISGPAGSGKSTTQACLIDKINKTRACHIITLEDPIEYLHRHDKSIVSQREISIDTEDYHSALRACLRQSPDVILLGEMRDYETIKTAMTAAETGNLVIGTLHTRGASSTVERIIDSFPSEQQNQIRVQLASVLHSIVSQQMVVGVNGNMVPAFEVMHVNPAIRSMIRDRKDHQIDNALATGSAEGMISMDQALLGLFKDGLIAEDTALAYADNGEQMQRKLNQR